MAISLAILEKPIGICSEHISDAPTTLRLKQDRSTLSSSGYTVTDASGSSILYTSKKKHSSWNSRQSLYDSFNIPLFDLDYDRRFWMIKKPDRENDPVATMFRREQPGGDFVGIRFNDAVSDRDVTLSVRAKFTEKRDDQCATSKDVCVYHDGKLVMQTKMVDRYMARVPFKGNEWDVHVAEGMDKSLASAIGIYFAIVLCEKPVVTKTEALLGVLLPGGMVGAGIGTAGAGVGSGGGGGGGDSGGGGGC